LCDGGRRHWAATFQLTRPEKANMVPLLELKFKIRNCLLKHKRLGWLERPIRAGYSLFNRMRCSINRIVFWRALLRTRKYVHLGCGDRTLTGAINVDSRATRATDIRQDCKSLEIFPKDYFVGVVSNAFWEHVFLNDRQHVVDEAHRIIREDGFALFLGIPDFERIAIAYLNKEQGITSQTFDLSQVYRFTHGDPESTPKWWFGNLHKSLFDVETVLSILRSASFRSWIVFRYSYGNEAVPGQLGFLAYKKQRIPSNVMNQQLRELLLQFHLTFVNVNSLEIVHDGENVPRRDCYDPSLV
jgi:predicted SAM-dependent methyltransferase